MKQSIKSRLSLLLAGALPFMPLLRSVLPVADSPGPASGAIILRWAIGAVICGYDAISSASSVSISPPSATIGVQYNGTITYSGGHAGSVVSMKIQSTCLGSYAIAPGLTATYNGVNTATVSGIPSGSAGTVPLTVVVYDGYSCTGGLTDTRSTSLIVQNSGGGPVTPSMIVAPQNTIAQVGSDVILSGGASGNPTPTYFWKQGTTLIPGATQNTLTIPAAQMTNAGIYTLYASNSQGTANSSVYLTMCLTPGSDILGLFYTNYYKAGTSVTMSSFMTNVLGSTNTYSWQYNNGNVGVTASNFTFSTTPIKSGTYSVTFNSVVGSTTVVNNQQYNSYWVFGYPPTITNQPVSTNVSSGGNVTFSGVIEGGNYSVVSLYQNGTTLVAQTNLAGYNPNTPTSTTNVSFTISNLTSGNSGTYVLIATNYWGTNAITNTLNVTSPLSVTAPQGVTNYAGKTVSMTANASGVGPFSYQWQKGGASFGNGGNISGANTNMLVFSPALTNNSGNYQVVVTNNSGGAITSSVAPLDIVPIPQLVATPGTGTVGISAAGGVVGSNYVVETSSDLADPNSWVPVQTNSVPGNGSINYSDSIGSSNKFYRIEFP